MPRKSSASVKRNTALVYVRQSVTKQGEDQTNPERQRALAQACIDAEGWTAEWYEDAEGHKSGRSVANRPGWQDLARRLEDPDVVAIVAYDLARLHRKGWRIGDLLERVEQLGLRLILTQPGLNFDLSTSAGKFMAQITAMLDEAYSDDVSRRTKAAVVHLKAQGKNVGNPPFGTKRNPEGYLMPSLDGAWYLLGSGQFVVGNREQQPQEDAIWRSYYECAGYILTLYAEGFGGKERIARKLNEEGWPFRNRQNKPRPVTDDDVRRVIANWPEYGGLVPEKSAKDRPAYEDTIDPAHLIEARAVFPLELLRSVASVRKERTREPEDSGVRVKAKVYALSKLVYCAHCERRASDPHDAHLRTRLIGYTDSRDKRRYKHVVNDCSAVNRSVLASEIEGEVGKLLRLLSIKEDALGYMTELALETDPTNIEQVDLEKQKQEAVALCQRRIAAAVNLYGDGFISHDEYKLRVDQNQREIALWEARTAESQQAALELAMCVQAVNTLAQTWETADDEDRHGMLHHLFDFIEFDLDTRRIEGFQLKPWADRFLTVRADLLYEELENETALKDDQGGVTPMPHRGLEPLFLP